MHFKSDTAEVEAVLQAVRRGHLDKDAAVIGAQFSPGAMIFDLAPPLGHGLDVPGLAAWLDSWEGPIEHEAPDLTILTSGDLAVCYGFCRISATTSAEGQRAQWWQRLTICLRRMDGVWKIIHEHESVPFYMDGSFRAAIDLRPE